jgi:hypothetical protein
MTGLWMAQLDGNEMVPASDLPPKIRILGSARLQLADGEHFSHGACELRFLISAVGEGCVQNLSHIGSGNGDSGFNYLLLIKLPHVHVVRAGAYARFFLYL